MRTIDLLYAALKPKFKKLDVQTFDEVCCFSGKKEKCVLKNLLITSSFTQKNLMAAPQSDYIGVKFYQVWRYGYLAEEGKKRLKCPERMSSWFVNLKEFKEINKADIREIVFTSMEEKSPWACYITTSYKKHGSIITPINTGKQKVIQLEGVRADCSDPALVSNWFEKMKTIQAKGAGRTSIETLNLSCSGINKIGWQEWIKFKEWAEPKMRTGLYTLLCYVLPTQEELKHAK